MTQTGFPRDEYTPHGYLANPFAVASSWSDGEGGCLRTTRDHVGVGWQLPWSLRAHATFDLVLMLDDGTTRASGRAAFEPAGLHSPHHSANLFVYRWELFGRVWEAAYTLVAQDVLGLQVTWQPSPDGESGSSTVLDMTARRRSTLRVGLIGWRREYRSGGGSPPFVGAPGSLHQGQVFDADGWIDLGERYGRCELVVDAGRLHGEAWPSESLQTIWGRSATTPSRANGGQP